VCTGSGGSTAERPLAARQDALDTIGEGKRGLRGAALADVGAEVLPDHRPRRGADEAEPEVVILMDARAISTDKKVGSVKAFYRLTDEGTANLPAYRQVVA
jgi:hypothetical protein